MSQESTLLGPDKRYSLEKELGRGGMGVTFLARDLQINPPHNMCVIKMMSHRLNPNESIEKYEKLIAFFRREASRLVSLKHPSIPSFRNTFTEHLPNGSTELFLVQEYIEGKTLWEEFTEVGSFSLDKSLTIFREILTILIYLHEYKDLQTRQLRPILHLDIKPQNLIKRTQDQKLFLIDFGLASQIDPDTNLSIGSELTMPGFTAGYAPPEQIKGRVSQGSDLYSLAVTFLVLYSGRAPREVEISLEHKKISNLVSGLSPSFQEMLYHMTTAKLSDRLQSARAARDKLDALSLSHHSSNSQQDEYSESFDSSSKGKALDSFPRDNSEPKEFTDFNHELEPTDRNQEKQSFRKVAALAVIGIIILFSLDFSFKAPHPSTKKSSSKTIQSKLPKLLLENCARGKSSACLKLARFTKKLSRCDLAEKYYYEACRQGFIKACQEPCTKNQSKSDALLKRAGKNIDLLMPWLLKKIRKIELRYKLSDEKIFAQIQQMRRKILQEMAQNSHKTLHRLIDKTESMDPKKNEKSYWKQILKRMTSKQVINLTEILLTEKKDLSKIDREHNFKLHYMKLQSLLTSQNGKLKKDNIQILPIASFKEKLGLLSIAYTSSLRYEDSYKYMTLNRNIYGWDAFCQERTILDYIELSLMTQRYLKAKKLSVLSTIWYKKKIISIPTGSKVLKRDKKRFLPYYKHSIFMLLYLKYASEYLSNDPDKSITKRKLEIFMNRWRKSQPDKPKGLTWDFSYFEKFLFQHATRKKRNKLILLHKRMKQLWNK